MLCYVINLKDILCWVCNKYKTTLVLMMILRTRASRAPAVKALILRTRASRAPAVKALILRTRASRAPAVKALILRTRATRAQAVKTGDVQRIISTHSNAFVYVLTPVLGLPLLASPSR